MNSKSILSLTLIAIILLIFSACFRQREHASQKIDREVLVRRHNVIIDKIDSLSSLTVGNGSFAYTVDATGLQSFPEKYEKGICLGTQSDWGWHSFPNTENYNYQETLKEFDFHGRKISYDVQRFASERKRAAANYFRQNPHRLHLGIIGLEMYKKDGTRVQAEDIKQIHQELDLWSGTISSKFTVNDQPVEVTTYCHQDLDLVSAEINSPLIASGQLKICLRFPYPSGGHVDSGCDWTKPEKHKSVLKNISDSAAEIFRKIDNTNYYVDLRYDSPANIDEPAPHHFILSPDKGKKVFTFSCQFSRDSAFSEIPDFNATRKNNSIRWEEYWNSGGAVDFYGSKDKRAFELERRIVLSQYLMKIQCAGNYPPQETGLTFNSWYGKFHLEMHWWHAVHFALWNRIELLEKSLDYYAKIAEKARKTAKRQGFDGVRWPKMTDPSGQDSPSDIGSFLIWQQPHFIYYAELCYRNHGDSVTLHKYANLVFKTADFMASYAQYDKAKDRYVLGPTLIPAQECFKASKTMDPPFELAYWHWGLSTAQKWCERMQLPRKPLWDSVLAKLSPLPVSDNLYLFAETAPDSYTKKHTYDHPMVLGAYGVLPLSPMIDTSIMHNTFDRIWKDWQWDKTWGWDFPMTAMTATRLGMPEKAIDALFMNIRTNTYLVNGHNYQDSRLRIYLPGNGGLLTTVALMCAGYDGCETINPGFPTNGTWKIRWENLSRMP